jgi:two-component system, NarL family, response regulator DegU
VKLNSSIQMVLASSSRLFLEGIHKILENEDNIQIMVEASNPEEVEKYLTEIRPKFLFIDNRTFDLDIRRLSKLIIKNSPDTKIILFGNHIENGFTFPNVIHITKETESLELMHIIKTLKQGALAKWVNGIDTAKQKLGKMELKVIRLISHGFSNKEIAKRLSLSERTVKNHLTHVFKKLNLQNRYQLIRYAVKLDLI